MVGGIRDLATESDSEDSEEEHFETAADRKRKANSKGGILSMFK